MTEGSNFPTIGGNQTPEDREAVGVGPEKVGRPGDEGKPRDSKSMILEIERVLQNPRQPRLFWEEQ